MAKRAEDMEKSKKALADEATVIGDAVQDYRDRFGDERPAELTEVQAELDKLHENDPERKEKEAKETAHQEALSKPHVGDDELPGGDGLFD